MTAPVEAQHRSVADDQKLADELYSPTPTSPRISQPALDDDKVDMEPRAVADGEKVSGEVPSPAQKEMENRMENLSLNQQVPQSARGDDKGPAERAQPDVKPSPVADDSKFLDEASSQDQKIEHAISLLTKHRVCQNNPERQVRKFNLLRDPMTATEKSKQDKYKKAQKRAISLTSYRDTNYTEAPEAYHQFDNKEFPGYKTLLMVNDKKTRVQRSQLSGLCYMHAPVVVQYYAIWHSHLKLGRVSDHQMIDMRATVLQQFSPDELEDHVFRNRGGSSRKCLKDILQPKSKLHRSDKVKEYEDCLKKYGPGLVSQFQVYPDFKKRDIRHHHGLPQGNSASTPSLGHNILEGSSPNRHAMVLVGAKFENGTWYFLLQNWWKEKQFLEVDATYLESCGAVVRFVKTPQFEVPTDFEKFHGRVAETSHY